MNETTISSSTTSAIRLAMAEIVLGTHNQKKGIELHALLQPHGMSVLTLREFDDALHVVEDGETFAENAAKKASQQSVHLNRWVLSEDSGLMVDALGGAPGIYSARFSGPDADDESNNRQLLEKLSGVPLARRTAHYHCHVALADPTGAIRAESWGECHGRVLVEAAGSGGFGYDPLFQIDEYHMTFAELGDTVKTMLSHRSRAMRALIPQLVRLLTNTD